MRLIGNKTRLLAEIEGFLRDRGVRGGTFIDIFSGTASVARHFKRLGFRVIANDHMAACHAQAVAALEVNAYPPFEAVREKHRRTLRSAEFRRGFAVQPVLTALGAPASDPVPLAEVIHLVGRQLPPREGLIFRSFCPGGGKGRMYFRDEIGRRIDAVLGFLRENHEEGLLSRGELHLVLAALLDAADRVANISGTYGAYLKTWQRSALAPIRLEVPEVIESPLEHEAFRRDSNELVRELRGDVLYIDPPYNKRQYGANYHILEIIAEHHEVEDLEAYEAALYGKTGLKPYDGLKSAYCVPPCAARRGENVLSAMTDLILSARADHVLVSYNEEGLLTREELGAILSRFAGTRSFAFDRDMRTVLHKRFCSDSDRSAGGAKGKRRYRVLDGKGRGEISEWLLLGSRERRPRRARRNAEATQATRATQAAP
ncbi:MAG: DNA adenine methylase [Planctomycetes bacterium]|nr:DNA adenine methylase [Planctomycetota bacterium]